MLKDGEIHHPLRSFGMDSSRVLEEVMNSPARNRDTEETLRKLALAVDRENFDDAKLIAASLRKLLGDDAAEVLQAETMMHFLETP